VKLFAFNLCNGYFSLFYIAFYQRQVDRLRYQLLSLVLMRLTYRNVVEVFPEWSFTSAVVAIAAGAAKALLRWLVLIPRSAVRRRIAPAAQGKDPAGAHPGEHAAAGGSAGNSHAPSPLGRSATTALSLAAMEREMKLREHFNAVDEGLEVAMQYGYMTLFPAALPYMAALLLLNNVLELRIDARKQHRASRMPPPQDVADGIGPQHEYLAGFFLIINTLSLLTNAIYCVTDVVTLSDGGATSSPVQLIIDAPDSTLYVLLALMVLATTTAASVAFPGSRPPRVSLDLHRQSYFCFKLSRIDNVRRKAWRRAAARGRVLHHHFSAPPAEPVPRHDHEPQSGSAPQREEGSATAASLPEGERVPYTPNAAGRLPPLSSSP